MIKIICVGKIKEEFFKEAIKEYLKRLTKYTRLEIVEVSDFSENSLVREALLIEKHLNKEDYLVTLEIEGKSLDSFEFSKLIENQMIHGKNITFVIGGSYGIDNIIKEKADFHLTFSKLTFPHQLFRVMLLEQIYRSFKIMKNEAYHK